METATIIFILSILIAALTFCILKDTHIKVYYKGFGDATLEQEHDAKMTVWRLLVIIVLGFLPVVNIVLFALFILYYGIHAGWNPNKCDGYTHVFSLKGGNVITKTLLKVKKALCKRI